MFGFPSGRHQRLGEKVFGYRHLTSLEPLVGSIPDGDSAAEVKVGDFCQPGQEAPWKACRVFGIERSVSFLNWRYYARPVRYYRFYELRAGGAQGLAVFAFVGEEAWAAELWLPAGGEWYPSLLAVGADLRRSGLSTWRFWPPPTLDGLELLRRLGLRGAGETCFVACRAHPGEDPMAPAAGFFHAMGDYDIV
jgi:hypothetical protein